MTTDRKEMNVVNELDSIQRQEWESLAATTSFKTFLATREQYWKIASKDLPFDTRRNAVHWCLDVNRLIDEIVFSYTLMKGYVTLFKKTNPAGNFPSSSSFHVSYYADNCIARLDSCRDKLALAIWAYYCPFNPERRAEVLTYDGVIDRLRRPRAYGLPLVDQGPFLRSLERLESIQGNEFSRLNKYRDLKVHRREPRIEINGVKPHHDWPYMLPLYSSTDIQRFDRELEKTYPDAQSRAGIRKGCEIGGVLYESRRLTDRLWEYDEVEPVIKTCLSSIVTSSTECLNEFLKRPPLG